MLEAIFFNNGLLRQTGLLHFHKIPKQIFHVECPQLRAKWLKTYFKQIGVGELSGFKVGFKNIDFSELNGSKTGVKIIGLKELGGSKTGFKTKQIWEAKWLENSFHKH